MKKYRAVVIDGKKIVRNTLIAALIAAAGIAVLSVLALSGRQLLRRDWISPQDMISGVITPADAANGAWAQQIERICTEWKGIVTTFLSFDPTNPTTILAAEMPVSAAVSRGGLVTLAAQSAPPTQSTATPPSPTQTPAPTPSPILSENQAPIKSIDVAGKASGGTAIAIGNQTSYSINIEEMLSSPPNINMGGSGPKVLITHTHATEAYSPENAVAYDKNASDRSTNTDENVVKMGDTLAQIFKDKGIETLHDTELHDTPSFNGAYAHSLNAIEHYLSDYPSIQVVFDVHRDSIVYDDGTKAKAATEINGKTAAQLMFVVGTDEKGLFHPHWRENMKTAIHFQNAIVQKYPTLMRHINLRQERFNGHTTNGSMIIEVGTSGNSLSEAAYGLSCAGECIADYLNSLK